MQITFVTDGGENFSVEIDPDMKLLDVQALLEAEVSHSPTPRSHCIPPSHPMRDSGYSLVSLYPSKPFHSKDASSPSHRRR